MPTGRVTEEGVINGISYRKRVAYGNGKTLYYIGGGRGKRRGRGWLRKQKKKELTNEE